MSGARSMGQGVIELKDVNVSRPRPLPPEENWCVFDLNIDQVHIELSLIWFLRGNGWVKEISVRGVRGVVDRRTEWQNPNWKPRSWDIGWGDFHFQNVKVTECGFLLRLPDPEQRPIPVVLEKLECPRIRRRYLLYDMMCSNIIEGSVDGRRMTYVQVHPETVAEGREMMLKMEKFDISLLSKNSTGPLGWIVDGKMDMDVQVSLPKNCANVNDVRINLFTSLQGAHLDPPLFSDEVSYITNVLAYPVARYFNRYKKGIQLNSQIVIPQEHLDRCWSPAEAEFWDKMSESVSDSLTDLYFKTRPTSLEEWWQYIYKTITA